MVKHFERFVSYFFIPDQLVPTRDFSDGEFHVGKFNTHMAPPLSNAASARVAPTNGIIPPLPISHNVRWFRLRING